MYCVSACQVDKSALITFYAPSVGEMGACWYMRVLAMIPVCASVTFGELKARLSGEVTRCAVRRAAADVAIGDVSIARKSTHEVHGVQVWAFVTLGAAACVPGHAMNVVSLSGRGVRQ